MEDFSAKINRTLAADVRFAQIDLKGDQVWELDMAGGEPPALAVQTTYGLRCRGLKIFPRFTMQGTTLTDPRTFAEPPRLKKRLTNYVQVTCTPFTSINLFLEFWVPSSSSICGRMRVVNHGTRPVALNCEWAVLLQPLGRGEPMTSAEMGINTILRGASEDLFPVFFLTGGPRPSDRAYPALGLDVTLAAGMERQVSWSLASLDSYEASFTLARQNTALPWDSELIRHEMAEKRTTFHFASDKPGWDDLLLETQAKARQYLIDGPAPARRLTLLSKRQPDAPLGNFAISARTRQGNLPATVYDLWLASRILLPAEPELFKELIFEFIDHQQASGAIPWNIAANGSASKALTPPLLAGIARDVHLSLHDFTWLAQVYAPLLEACKYWFTAAPAGWPVWTYLLQTNLDQSPLYSLWHVEDQGIDLQFVDSPALGAMLYHECQALLQIGGWLSKNEDAGWLQAKAAELKEHLAGSWNEQMASYQYRDVQNGSNCVRGEIYQASANAHLKVKLDCGGERRVIVRCDKANGLAGLVEIVLTGKNSGGSVTEMLHFSPGQFQEGVARVTSQHFFSRIDKIQTSGLEKEDSLRLTLAGFDDEDISLLLPLWAGIPSQVQAEALVEKTLLPRYLAKYGLADLPLDRYPERAKRVSPFWNEILIEGLLQYGMRTTAAEVWQAFLTGVTTQWQTNGTANAAIRVEDGQGVGERDSLSGLPGILPFLHLLGVESIGEKEIIFSGLNDFLSPITVQYGRVNLSMQADVTTIATLNGSQIENRDPGRHKIVLP